MTRAVVTQWSKGCLAQKRWFAKTIVYIAHQPFSYTNTTHFTYRHTRIAALAPHNLKAIGCWCCWKKEEKTCPKLKHIKSVLLTRRYLSRRGQRVVVVGTGFGVVAIGISWALKLRDAITTRDFIQYLIMYASKSATSSAWTDAESAWTMTERRVCARNATARVLCCWFALRRAAIRLGKLFA